MAERQRKATPALVGATAAAAAGFAALATANAQRRTWRGDLRARARTPGRKSRTARKVAAATAPTGKWAVYGPVALAASAYVWKERGGNRGRGRRGAAAMMASVALSVLLAEVLDRIPPNPPAPPGRRNPMKRVFPSGHTLRTTAISLTTGYVLARERLARPRAAALALALPVATGVGRMAEDKHWASDVLGGLLAGTVVAGVCLAGYELGE